MFGDITDALGTGFDAVAGLLDGEIPTSKQVAELISMGMCITDIASASGVSAEVIQALINE
ncbi:MAG: hypothetical protein BMS9Abin31_1210 [Gammaproteobacteria bacterium]|nr:MAG: hypothetical protein BMS9Abin31_1210 [Gammaproteobacteria bacterium]